MRRLGMGLRWMHWALTAAVCVEAAMALQPGSDGGTGAEERSVAAVSCRGSSVTTVNLRNTGLAPRPHGLARVQAARSGATVMVELRGLTSPTLLGSEILTYVLWAIPAKGAAVNLGSIPFDRAGHAKRAAKTQFATFALLVTAEPYSEVRKPSELVILETSSGGPAPGALITVVWHPVKRSAYGKVSRPTADSMDLRN